MPPDRTQATTGTAQRFSDAIASGQPLSSVGPGHAPSLERGKVRPKQTFVGRSEDTRLMLVIVMADAQACQTCRRRRVKCDGVKPVCGRCAKSARVHGEDPDSFTCVYDAPGRARAPSKSTSDKAADGKGKGSESAAVDPEVVASLARQVGEFVRVRCGSLRLFPSLEHALTEQLARQNGGSIPSSAPPQQPPFSSQQTSHAYPTASTSAFTLDHQHHRDPLALLAESSSLAMPTQQQQSLPFFSTVSSSATSAAPTSSFAMPPLASTAQDVPVSSTPQYWAAATTPTQSSSTSAPQAAASTFASAFDFSQLDGLGSLSWDGPVDLTLSGYPSDLPSPSILRRLVDVYFSKPHLATGLINEARFRASMTYPPDDPRAPIPCLLHAMIATAAMMVAEDSFFASESYRYWDLDGSGTSLCDYHAVRAESLLNPSLKQGRQLLQIVQASVLCCFCAYTSARFADIWLLSAQSSRLAICVGLNQIRLPGMAGGAGSYASPAGATPDSASGGGWTPHSALPKKRQTTSRLKDKSMLPPTTDPDELAERSSVFYFVFGQDRMTSAATGWAPVLSEEDITTLLPHPPGSPDTSDDLLASPLCIHNPSFFFANPPHLVRSHQLCFKAFVLLGRVTRFLQRAPEPVGSGYPLSHGQDLRETSAYQNLERTISHFRMSIPRELQHSYYTSPAFENVQLFVFTLLHVCTILMHEPFCLSPSTSEDDDSFRKCLEAAKAIVSSVHELAGSSFEAGLLFSFQNWMWAVAGRALIRALALASRRGDLALAAERANDVKALIRAQQANKSAVGSVTALILQRLLADPFIVLNESFSGSSAADDLHSSTPFPPSRAEKRELVNVWEILEGDNAQPFGDVLAAAAMTQAELEKSEREEANLDELARAVLNEAAQGKWNGSAM
uniref:BY PROTMAP: gi/342321075/gb/EGU13013.1/ Proteophosphoglycan 5 [Rhodotorula glutinis ATCC 204091] n=1 Tax=Rhodotorula toruloides TaxID=5286 RepID=A0A0K3CBS0_RHOTO